ncbi:MAG: T9SS type A sorting domain-containing protein [Microscillaceae bacterium]|nr:T9SS type A sorting domain-containing protein [Microscillaceae bacterium]
MKLLNVYTFICALILYAASLKAQESHSVARQWNEALLLAIRTDFARPTVQARNLFHTSLAMYEAWAVYDSVAIPFLLGKTVGNYTCEFNGIPVFTGDKKAAREEAISYAVYRLLKFRFRNSPGIASTNIILNNLMSELGYDVNVISIDYSSGSPAALGNYIAKCIIEFGLQDGSNEANNFANQHYTPVNPPLEPNKPGNPSIINSNRWQPLSLPQFIDQAGNPVLGTPAFLTPEWGQVIPFALKAADRTVYQRGNFDYWVYHDPGTPPQLDANSSACLDDPYKWAFVLVSVWSSHLAPSDQVMIDISPNTIGNASPFPQNFADYDDFYDLFNGGDTGLGYDLNPATGQPYAVQMVPRGDYTRVLAEFWADGPNSETPPGHWYTILNYVNDHPQLVKKFKGEGEILDDLEWDVKAYFVLGGAMHDAAISAWGVKGWYDYIRPISAIRAMAERGQCSNPSQPRYHKAGIPLIENYIELVKTGDPLAGANQENVNKIKLYTWRGPAYIQNAQIDEAGVGWILAENWWPYQRPTFVTPPFAGYVSGHSTYSRAAAEVLTMLTGDAYFPGGMGEFPCPKNQFLVFEEGPSMDITLQWATYRDASNQCSLSRIWGGIHPPIDDIPGRIIGEKVGIDAFQKAEKHFKEPITPIEDPLVQQEWLKAYPNPSPDGNVFVEVSERSQIRIFDVLGKTLSVGEISENTTLNFPKAGIWFIQVSTDKREVVKKIIIH